MLCVFLQRQSSPKENTSQTSPLPKVFYSLTYSYCSIFVAIYSKSSFKYYEAHSITMWQHLPMNNICSNVYVYLYYIKRKPTHVGDFVFRFLPFFSFLHCLCFKFFVPSKALGKCINHIGYSAAIVTGCSAKYNFIIRPRFMPV